MVILRNVEFVFLVFIDQNPYTIPNGFVIYQANAVKMSSKPAKFGLAAVLAYGLFDGVTYTTFFILVFLGYEKSTEKNPAANSEHLLVDMETASANLICLQSSDVQTV